MLLVVSMYVISGLQQKDRKHGSKIKPWYWILKEKNALENMEIFLAKEIWPKIT